MPLPTRPVADATIETDWGQAIHDYTFAPAGCLVSGSAVSMPSGGTLATLDLSTADDDPGGYLDAANDRIVIPTDGEGLYAISAHVNTVNGLSLIHI